MKKLLIASSVALLALSFQAGAAGRPLLQISKADTVADNLRMALLYNPVDIDVAGSSKIARNEVLSHDYGISRIEDSAETRIANFTSVASNDAKVTGVGLYSDTSFTTKIADAVFSTRNGMAQWVLYGSLDVTNHVYGLRVEAKGGANLNSGSYTTNTSTVPVPGAVWLFGSAIAGLVGFSKRKKAGLAA